MPVDTPPNDTSAFFQRRPPRLPTNNSRFIWNISFFVSEKMAPAIRACPICGWIILDPGRSVSWMNQFRGCKPPPAVGRSCHDRDFLTGPSVYILRQPRPYWRWSFQ